MAGTGAVLASLASTGINLPLVARVAGRLTLTCRLGRALGVIVVLGILGAVAQQALVPRLVMGLVGS